MWLWRTGMALRATNAATRRVLMTCPTARVADTTIALSAFLRALVVMTAAAPVAWKNAPFARNTVAGVAWKTSANLAVLVVHSAEGIVHAVSSLSPLTKKP